MSTARTFLHRYRYSFAALAISLAVHAGLIVGVPGQAGGVPDPEPAKYSVQLAPLPDLSVAVPGPLAAPPAPLPQCEV